jgi:hypothetical protein
MPSTYEPIATQTLGSAASSVTFSSISGAYTDLILVISSNTTALAGEYLRVGNGSLDTGSNYSYTYLNGTGSAAGSGRGSNQTATTLDISGVAGLGANNFNVSIVNFMNYSNTTTNKTILARNSNAQYGTDAVVSLWRSTSAINTIQVYPNGANYNAGSTFTLYGIKAA